MNILNQIKTLFNSSDFYKDTLIVFFERSTWQLRYTGNEILPFVWDRVNSDRGAEATWSSVKLDQGVAAIGYNGIMLSNGVNTERLDSKIPDLVFSFGNEEEIPKIHGVRDYWAEAIYWTFVSQNVDQNEALNFPDRMLYYNYKENTWAIFKNSYTVLANFTTFKDRAWNTFTNVNEDFWKNLARPWTTPLNIKGFPIVVAGNQQGFVSQLFNAGPDNSNIDEDISLQCSSVTPTVTATNHNLVTGSFVKVEGSGTGSDGQIFQVLKIDKDSFTALPDPDPDAPGPAIANFALGFLVRVENFDITTKRLNPVIEQGKMGRLIYLDIFVENVSTTADSFQSELLIDNDENNIVQQLQIDPTTTNSKVWKRIFFNSTGSFFTTRFNFSQDQMFKTLRNTTDVRIHALLFNMRDAGGRLTK